MSREEDIAVADSFRNKLAQVKDLCIPRHPPLQRLLKPRVEAPSTNLAGMGAAIVNAWVLRQETFAQRRSLLPQDDSVFN